MEADTFLIDGFELAPWYRDRLRADLPGIEVRACSSDTRRSTPSTWPTVTGRNLNTKPRCRSPSLRLRRPWIRARSRQLRGCRDAGLFYVDVAEAGFETAMSEARQALLLGAKS